MGIIAKAVRRELLSRGADTKRDQPSYHFVFFISLFMCLKIFDEVRMMRQIKRELDVLEGRGGGLQFDIYKTHQARTFNRSYHFLLLIGLYVFGKYSNENISILGGGISCSDDKCMRGEKVCDRSIEIVQRHVDCRLK